MTVVERFSKAARIPVSPTRSGIRSHLKIRLDGDTTPKAMDDELRPIL